ncbi:MAG: insulinase family protein [Thermoanaerobaculia bacterium]|nr:insulinase family protein [Thermoanaerobaculia bacterium]
MPRRAAIHDTRPVLFDFASLPLHRFALDNGLRVVVHVDRRLPLVAVNLWYHVGSKHERPGRTGLAHLFEHMLFQGSAHVETNGHFRHLQRVGGVANGSTWYDRTNYYETVPSSQLELALWLESDRMGFLLESLDQRKLDNQRDVVLNERRQTVDNRPYGRPYERLFELLLPAGHPYQWPVIGRADDIAAATLADVHAFFATWYRPANAVLTLAGDVEPAAARAAVERWFGELDSGEAPPRTSHSLAPRETAVRETVADDVRLPRVYLAFRTPPYGDPRWHAGSLLAGVLADGRASTLYRDLVWERQLAQEAGAFLYPTAELGIFVAYATARPGVEPQRLADELRRHLDDAAEPAPNESVDRARNRRLSSLWEELESLDDRADRLSMHATLFDRPERAWEEPSRYLRLTAAEMADFGREFLAAERAVELTVVPRGEPR